MIKEIMNSGIIAKIVDKHKEAIDELESLKVSLKLMNIKEDYKYEETIMYKGMRRFFDVVIDISGYKLGFYINKYGFITNLYVGTKDNNIKLYLFSDISKGVKDFKNILLGDNFGLRNL